MSTTKLRIVSLEEWQAALAALQLEEKAATRARDALAAKRRRLPMVEMTKGYVFEGAEGITPLGRQETW